MKKLYILLLVHVFLLSCMGSYTGTIRSQENLSLSEGKGHYNLKAAVIVTNKQKEESDFFKNEGADITIKHYPEMYEIIQGKMKRAFLNVDLVEENNFTKAKYDIVIRTYTWLWGNIVTFSAEGFETKEENKIFSVKSTQKGSVERTKGIIPLAILTGATLLLASPITFPAMTRLAGEDVEQRLSRLFSRVLDESVESLLKDQSLKMYAEGYNYKDIAKSLDSPAKTSVVTSLHRKEELPPSSKSTSTLWQPVGRQQVWVLAVGVSQHKQLAIPSLPFAKSDAMQFRDWFLKLPGRQVPRENVRILTDEQATRQNLLDQIDWLRKQTLPEDAVFVYFAGHGAPELSSDGKAVDAKYLVLYDTDPSRLFATGLSIDELSSKLDVIKAKAQVLVLEACYTGPVGQDVLSKTPTADLEIRPRIIREMGEKGGRVILSASTGRQMAIGSQDIKGALFTHYLLDAWGNGSKRLLSVCFDDAKDQVRRAANRLGSTQEPTRFGDQNLDVVLQIKP